jgi:hypothetical protein
VDVPRWVWLLTLAGIALLLVFDFVFHVRKAHVPSLKEAGTWSALYLGIALLFGAPHRKGIFGQLLAEEQQLRTLASTPHGRMAAGWPGLTSGYTRNGRNHRNARPASGSAGPARVAAQLPRAGVAGISGCASRSGSGCVPGTVTMIEMSAITHITTLKSKASPPPKRSATLL